jgi:thiosulfate dehydrogenase (quinone) large subunit
MTRFSLIGGAMIMIALTVGSCLIQDWQAAGLQLFYQIAYSALLFLRRYNNWSADVFLRNGFISGRTNFTPSNRNS